MKIIDKIKLADKTKVILITVVAVSVATLSIILGIDTHNVQTSDSDTETQEANATPTESPLITSISFREQALTLEVGDMQDINLLVQPENGNTNTITYTSSDANVAQVESGVIKAVGSGNAEITATAGSVSAICKVTVQEPYKIKDSRNSGFEKLNNGTVIEYCCEYKDYILSLYKMTDYQRENRSHEKNGLYVHITGKVIKVREDGSIVVETEQPDMDITFGPFLCAFLTLDDSQRELIAKLNVNDNIDAYAIIDDYSYDRDQWITEDMSNGIITEINSRHMEIPQSYKPLDTYSENNGTAASASEGYPCLGTYYNGEWCLSIEDNGPDSLNIKLVDYRCTEFQQIVRYDPNNPYDTTFYVDDSGTYEILIYKPGYSLMLTDPDGNTDFYFNAQYVNN